MLLLLSLAPAPGGRGSQPCQHTGRSWGPAKVLLPGPPSPEILIGYIPGAAWETVVFKLPGNFKGKWAKDSRETAYSHLHLAGEAPVCRAHSHPRALSREDTSLPQGVASFAGDRVK